jgi:uncharacterized protein YndB with AHSA1/START domain
MWKWLGGCLLLVVAFFVGSLIWGIREMKKSLAPDGSVVVTIAATPARVFASLSHGDSAATWMAEGSTVLTSRHGPLVPGDTLSYEFSSRMRIAKQRAMILRVKEVVPTQLIVFELLAQNGAVMALRSESTASLGDSTRVTTRILPGFDSLAARDQGRKAQSDSGRSELARDMMRSLFAVQAKLELTKLKMRIEGTPQPVR